ncbi:MAG: hypothetical protein H5T97_07035 [Firmicutes bacterium]|nr:hypothetical protein [Bacillota bacterium]
MQKVRTWLRENAAAVGVGLVAVLVLAGLARLFVWWHAAGEQARAPARPWVTVPGQRFIHLPQDASTVLAADQLPAGVQLREATITVHERAGRVLAAPRRVWWYPTASGVWHRASGVLVEPVLRDPGGGPPEPGQTYTAAVITTPASVQPATVSFTVVPARPRNDVQYAYHTHVMVWAVRQDGSGWPAAYVAMTRDYSPKPVPVRIKNVSRVEVWLCGTGPQDGREAAEEDRGVWRPVLLTDLRVER